MERGRPRTFDEDAVLEAALAAFWRHGYESTSLSELTEVTGLTKPSLYAAFGNKEQLFLTALKRYREQQLQKHADALWAEDNLVDAMRFFLRSVAEMLTADSHPRGCMVVNTATACDLGQLPPSIDKAIRQTVEDSSFSLISQRLQIALKQKNLPADVDIEQLVDYFTTFMCGMAVMAKVGVTSGRLEQVIEQALTILPGSR